MKYQIFYSETAICDVEDLKYHIINVYKSPLTAARYLKGLYEAIKKLETTAESLRIQHHRQFSRYGYSVRRINYKLIAVIYTVHGSKVYIHRIIPSSSII